MCETIKKVFIFFYDTYMVPFLNSISWYLGESNNIYLKFVHKFTL